ncbi:DUF4397 domain-containing protein [Ideonella azotifigens]|uniref:DUF4397 domain-containing protein n=1 Tax=Ideonella azotifigens TaxID=513160 RepID=A0ABN1JNQ9_9BURK|nr:DUF4397 domain-containing protein [Ideonella azotifigens]MCD2339976.1 DUF4397 domain-containing protein [Ideonella azotifigens]
MPLPSRLRSSPVSAAEPALPTRRRVLQAAAGIVAGGSLLALQACGGADDGDTASLRLVNATVDFETARLQVDGSTVISSLAYGGTTSDYVSIDSGSRALALFSTSGTTGPSTAYSFNADTYNTVIAYGTLSAGMAFRRIEESNSAPSSGYFNVRLLHAAPLLDGLDLYISNTSSLADLTPTATISAIGNLGDFVAVEAGTYRVRLTPTGDHSTVLFDSGSDTSSRITFSSELIVTLAIVPRSSGSLPDITALPEKLAAGVLSNSLA